MESLNIRAFVTEVFKLVLAACTDFCGFCYEAAGADVLVLAPGLSGLPQLLAAAPSGHSSPPSPPFLREV